MKVYNHRQRGFTLVEIMIVVAIIGLLAAIAIPNFVRARTKSQTNTCIANLREIDGAVQRWALEHEKAGGDRVTFSDIQDYLGRGTEGAVVNTDIKCPAHGIYAVTDIQSAPTCNVPGHELAN